MVIIRTFLVFYFEIKFIDAERPIIFHDFFSGAEMQPSHELIKFLSFLNLKQFNDVKIHDPLFCGTRFAPFLLSFSFIFRLNRRYSNIFCESLIHRMIIRETVNKLTLRIKKLNLHLWTPLYILIRIQLNQSDHFSIIYPSFVHDLYKMRTFIYQV